MIFMRSNIDPKMHDVRYSLTPENELCLFAWVKGPHGVGLEKRQRVDLPLDHRTRPAAWQTSRGRDSYCPQELLATQASWCQYKPVGAHCFPALAASKPPGGMVYGVGVGMTMPPPAGFAWDAGG